MAVLHLGADGRLRHPDGSPFDANSEEGRALVEEARALRAKFDAALIAARERAAVRAAMLEARRARRADRKSMGGVGRASSPANPPQKNSGAR